MEKSILYRTGVACDTYIFYSYYYYYFYYCFCVVSNVKLKLIETVQNNYQ